MSQVAISSTVSLFGYITTFWLVHPFKGFSLVIPWRFLQLG
jgi:hypothetical protein